MSLTDLLWLSTAAYGVHWKSISLTGMTGRGR
jgi:hypothetical protein